MGSLLLVSFLNGFTFLHIFMILCTERALLQYEVPAAESDNREFQILKSQKATSNSVNQIFTFYLQSHGTAQAQISRTA